jgi:hypothetical protein
LGLLVLTLISAAALSEALVILLRLAWRAWRTPVIFADSAALIRPEDQWGPALVPWVLSQHNEHRIIVQRLSSLFGEAVLHLPPANVCRLRRRLGPQLPHLHEPSRP